MTVKEWLGRARNIDKYIAALRAEREAVYTRLTSSTARPKDERVQESSGNSAERLLTRYAEYGKQIDKEVSKLIAVKTEISAAIGKMDDYTLCTLLTDRYIRFMTWEQIAVDMNYSYVHVVHRLHPQALREMGRIIKM